MKGRETGLNKKGKTQARPRFAYTPFDGRRNGRKGRSSFSFLLPLRLRGKGEIPPGGGGRIRVRKLPPLLFFLLHCQVTQATLISEAVPLPWRKEGRWWASSVRPKKNPKLALHALGRSKFKERQIEGQTVAEALRPSV